jgi:transposase
VRLAKTTLFANRFSEGRVEKAMDGLFQQPDRSIEGQRRLKRAGEVALTIDSHVRELEWHVSERKLVMKDLKEVLEGSRLQERVKNLCSVPGVGPLTAKTFCLEIFRPERFNRPEALTSYLGLAPMVRHSGSGKAKARLRPVGQKRLRSLLIEAAWIWKRKDAYTADWYRRLFSRHGVAQKAIAALARKLAVILWRVCLERRSYRPGVVSE